MPESIKDRLINMIFLFINTETLAKKSYRFTLALPAESSALDCSWPPISQVLKQTLASYSGSQLGTGDVGPYVYQFLLARCLSVRLNPSLQTVKRADTY